MRLIEYVCDLFRDGIYPACRVVVEFITNRDCAHCKKCWCNDIGGIACEKRWSCGETIKKPCFERSRWL